MTSPDADAIRHPVRLTILLADDRHPAIEERYAVRQTELLLRRAAPTARVSRYEPRSPLPPSATELTLVVTDPRVVIAPSLVSTLVATLDSSGTDAAVPCSSMPAHPLQSADVQPYATLAEFEDAAAEIARRESGHHSVTWSHDDPGLFLIRSASLRSGSPSLEGLNVAIARGAYIHRFVAHRGQPREDLLTRIPAGAREILEFGCGEGRLGALIRERLHARVTGIELDPEAAAQARTRLDAVIEGDIRDLATSIDATYDVVIGGDVVEHLDDPWSVLESLRKVTRPGGHLLLSLPNVASASVLADLVQGRFDYVYLGILCAGHVRFFTRRSIGEMLESTGWTLESLEPQDRLVTPRNEQFITRLDSSGIEYERVDLDANGWYVLARNDPERN